eukprot:CAMPEP_0119132768 /NCGR_PEP_ID=MMETSP1310-20130426/12277_1 /TAXON_ID=464262 /ORGANISM="Genus nov. species nov., Strain RCC2339" /LENGTH=233 /DNA_ID=CAMNT_0007123421 /DNA_START=1 /DNA_END=699 /DNA_ORIENTATION=+
MALAMGMRGIIFRSCSCPLRGGSGAVRAGLVVDPRRVSYYSTGNEEGNGKDEGEAAEGEEAAQRPEEQEPCDGDSAVNAELEKALAESQDWKDKFYRLAAEQQNYKRIVQRDLENTKTFAIENFAKSLLDVSDNLTRGIAAASEDGDKAARFDSLLEGVKLTHTMLHKTFQAQDITEFDPLGEEFDPNVHTALFQQPAEKDEDVSTVINVVSTGFMFKDRVLRAASVGVAIKK